MIKKSALALVCSFTLLVGNAHSAVINWTGGAGSSNKEWSNFNNFSSLASPAEQDVTFDDTASGVSAGAVTNIVDGTVTIGTLNFTKANVASTTYHTTQINSGQTLFITGIYAQGLGNPPCSSGGACNGRNTNVTFTGAGSLVFNNSLGTFQMGQNSGSYSYGNRADTLDMAGLTSFAMNANKWDVGRVGAATNSLMTLADTNNITANTLDMGYWNDTAILELGRVNNININNLQIASLGVNSANGTVRFDTGLVNPSVVIRDVTGSGAANLYIAKPSQSDSIGLVDFTGGNVDGLFNLIKLATMSSADSGNVTATLTLNNGIINATNLSMSENIGTGTATATSTVNINGTGTIIATNVTMVDSNSGSNNHGVARINLGGGALRAANIVPGDNLGSGTKTREINFNSGTIGNISGGDLYIDSSISLKVLTGGTHVFDATSGQQLFVNANITGAGVGALNKTGAGKMLMLGTNSYVAPTNVLNGTLGGTGSSTSDFTVAAGATLAPGASAGTLYTDDLTMQANSNLEIEIGGLTAGSQYDQVISSGVVNLNGNLIVKLINGFSPTNADTFTILQGASVLGEFSGISVVGASGIFDIIYFNNQVLLTNYHVPEPSSISLVGMADLGLMGWSGRHRVPAKV